MKYRDHIGYFTDGIIIDFPEYKGRPRRTKSSHPYAYDPIITWQKYPSHSSRTDDKIAYLIDGEKYVPTFGTEYSDHLWHQDSERLSLLSKKYYGNDRGGLHGEHGRSPGKLEEILREWYGKPDLELLEIQEHCNWATGYQVWFYVFRYGNKEVIE